MTRVTAPPRRGINRPSRAAVVGEYLQDKDRWWRWWPLLILVVLALARWWAMSANPLLVLGLSVCTCVGIVAYLAHKLTDRLHWYYTTACLAAGTLGLVLVSLVGPAAWLNIACVIGWAWLSLAWWFPPKPRETIQDVPSSPDIPEMIERWNAHIKNQPGPMAGATLSDPVPFKDGTSYTINVVPGKQHLGTFESNLKLVSPALNVDLENLFVEQVAPRLLRLQVVETLPIKDTVYFDRPRHEDGRILIGPFFDGIGEAALRLYTNNRMHNTFLLGSTGVGKSRLIELATVTAMDMRNTVIFFMDGQDGASSPLLFEHATWAVGSDGALRMLAVLERIAKWRNQENRLNEWNGFTPSAERPGVWVVVDEQHAILPQAAKRFAKAVRSWGKLGISFLTADQDSGLEGFGHEDITRANLLAGNGFAMRTNSRVAANLMPGLAMHPYDFPLLPGYGVKVAAPGSGERTAPYRARYAPDEQDRVKAAAQGLALPVPTIEEWFERYEALELDHGAARAAGPDYLNRKEIAEREQGELLKLVNATDEEYAEYEKAKENSGVSPVSTVTEGSSNIASAIQGLPWDERPELSPYQIIVALKVTGLTPTATELHEALGALVSDGFLAQDGPGKPYRRSGRAA
jgi:hypothetical protein